MAPFLSPLQLPLPVVFARLSGNRFTFYSKKSPLQPDRPGMYSDLTT